MSILDRIQTKLGFPSEEEREEMERYRKAHYKRLSESLNLWHWCKLNHPEIIKEFKNGTQMTEAVMKNMKEIMKKTGYSEPMDEPTLQEVLKWMEHLEEHVESLEKDEGQSKK